MTTQSEQILENNLIKQLTSMKYSRISIPDEDALIANLKTQLETLNKTTFSDVEFSKILNHLNSGNVYDRSEILREQFHFTRDDGSSGYIRFLNKKEWCQNEFQVTNQVTQEGEYENRYDVTILINGLPLVQIELKRSGLEIKEAFNQVQRYHKHSYASGQGLFLYTQLYVISNGTNTKYYANNKKSDFKFTNYWTDKDNQKITKLEEFTDVFLDPCHVSKMIAHYIVLSSENNSLMVLRPYQYYAAEAIIEKVKTSTTGGYIWHTTGSGKTLTSFKTSQLLDTNPGVEKVLFVVDRNDLDTQTVNEFNKFRKGSVDPTDNTKSLVKQFGSDAKLIVTTIQKLNNAISNPKHAPEMDALKDKKIVFIFDECHRSQFGETHKKITDYFTNYQLFGFTGTPIFADNASHSKGMGKRTTQDLFGQPLHKYIITDAINDENVLPFSVEYVGRYKKKNTATEIDIDVEDIDRKELMESPQRIELIVKYIAANHNKKTHGKIFTAMMTVSNTKILAKYYELFKQQNSGLKIATIFSYNPNEEDGSLSSDDELDPFKLDQHSRDRLDSYISDYNSMFGTAYSTKSSQDFYNYYKDIGKRVKRAEIDILLVVNMFLTGFDSPKLNTLYVDKNLRHHGLIQAYSRTNRLATSKPFGNIVVFRNLRKATNEAIKLFSNPDAKSTIFMESYEVYKQQFDEELAALREITPTPSDVDSLYGETEKKTFVEAYRALLRSRNMLESFADFSYDNLAINEQEFANYGSKYLDIKDSTVREKEKDSILDEIDFELELIHRDTINVDFILRLLEDFIEAEDTERAKITARVGTLLGSDPKLRSKKELIEKFISESLPGLDDAEMVEAEFDNFWTQERVNALDSLVREEGLESAKLKSLVANYEWNQHKPRDSELIGLLPSQPSVLERQTITERIRSKFDSFVSTFLES